MREASPLFHPAKKERGPIGEERGARIEHGMGRVRPSGSSQDRVVGMTMKENFVLAAHRFLHLFPLRRSTQSLTITPSSGASTRFARSTWPLRLGTVDRVIWAVAC